MKWFDDFFYQKLKSKKVIAVGAFDEKWDRFDFLLLENIKGEVQRSGYSKGLSLEALQTSCGQYADVPIVLCLDNSKTLLSEHALDESEFSEEDFIHVSDDQLGVSGILRKHDLSELLSFFSKFGNHVIGLQLGAIGVLDYLPFSEDSPYYNIGNNTYELSEESISISPLKEQSQELEGMAFDARELLLYLGGSDYFVSELDTIVNTVRPKAVDFAYQLFYKKTLLFGSVICFTLFLLSAGIFVAYDQEVKVLEGEFKSNIELINKYQFYAKSILELENKMNISTRGIKYARLCTDIADDLPTKITLKQLSIDPVVLTSSNSRKGKFQEVNILKIKGSCRSLQLVSNWVSDLKQFAWVKDIRKQEIVNDSNEIIFNIEVVIGDVR